MNAGDPATSILIFLGLLLASAFFVAAEYAVLTLGRRRVEQIATDSPQRAGAAFSAAERTEEISLAAQLGSIVCTLVLGVVTADLVTGYLPGLPRAIGIAVGLAIVAILYLIIGQQIPRFLGSQHAGWVNHPVALVPLRTLAITLRPLIAVISFVLDAISDLLRLSRSAFYAPIYTLEDIRELVTQGHQQGVVEEDEREMIQGVFEFSDTVAREVMTPRIDMVAVPLDITLDELIEVVVQEGHSRIPVYEDTIDNIVGILLTKDLLLLLADPQRPRSPFHVGSLMREPYFVPDTKPVDDILAEFRSAGVHLAIVIDEFGGTYGLLTLEDLLEEIVGDINDEYDVEEPEFSTTPEGDYLIDGGVSISEVNERFGLEIPDADYDTIGGYIFGALGRVPVPGDRVEDVGNGSGVLLEVEEAEDRRVTLVRLRRADGLLASDR
jgi:putative hemolysin